MKKKIDCGFCDKGIAKLITKKIELTVKGKKYPVTQYLYKCDSCFEEFTTTDCDEKTLSQLPKRKHNGSESDADSSS